MGTALLASRISAEQIDRYYEQVAFDTASYFASIADGDFLAELKAYVETEEYQAIRNEAEENDDETLIRDHLEDHGLWERYLAARSDIVSYLRNMSSIKYLYVIACGDENALVDMCLIDDDEIPLYEVGHYEEREQEFIGTDFSVPVEPAPGEKNISAAFKRADSAMYKEKELFKSEFGSYR